VIAYASLEATLYRVRLRRAFRSPPWKAQPETCADGDGGRNPANLALERNVDFGLILVKYGLERILLRLSCSRHRDDFILRGALLFELWTEYPRMPTTKASGGPCLLISKRAKILIQIDIGSSDVVTPTPSEIGYPTLLEFPGPRLLAYPKETVIAEKLEALVKPGIVNTRMKDFYDLESLSRRPFFALSGRTEYSSVHNVAESRGSETVCRFGAISGASSSTYERRRSSFVRTVLKQGCGVRVLGDLSAIRK